MKWYYIAGLSLLGLIVAFLVFSPKSTVKSGTPGALGGGLGGTLTGAGKAAEGAASLWDAIAKSFKSDDVASDVAD
jgi:hypothetical protein